VLHFRSINTCHADVLKCLQVPVLDCLICWTTAQCQCLRIVLDATNMMLWAWFMLRNVSDALACAYLPNLYISITTTWSNPLAIWRNGYVPYSVVVSRESEYCLIATCTQIPNLDVRIIWGGCYEVWVFIISDTWYLSLVALQHIGLLLVEIPDVHRATLCAWEQMLTRIIESNTAHIWRMGRQGLNEWLEQNILEN